MKRRLPRIAERAAAFPDLFRRLDLAEVEQGRAQRGQGARDRHPVPDLFRQQQHILAPLTRDRILGAHRVDGELALHRLEARFGTVETLGELSHPGERACGSLVPPAPGCDGSPTQVVEHRHLPPHCPPSSRVARA